MVRVICLVCAMLFGMGGALAQDFAVNDEIILENDNVRGIPVHRSPRPSRFTYLEQGSTATVSEVSESGAWLHITTGSTAGWVLSRYAELADPTARPTLNFDPFASLTCEGDAHPNRSMVRDSDARDIEGHEDIEPYFAVCFDRGLRIPVWVAHRVTFADLGGDGDRSQSSWRQDRRIRPADAQATDREYTGQSFQRGHLAPAKAFTRSQLATDLTHLFSNAVPQRGSVNGGAWRVLEQNVLGQVDPQTSVWVVTGALMLELPDHCRLSNVSAACICLSGAGDDDADPHRMVGRITAPSHTFKAIFVSDGETHQAYGFVMANVVFRMGSFLRYQYSIDTLEELSGLDLFAGPDGQDLVEEERLIPFDPTNRRVTRCQS